MGDYAEDCIHLHACRRMAKIYRESKSFKSYFIARGCGEECTAYQRAEKVYAIEATVAYDIAVDGAYMAQSGYAVEGDALCLADFAGEYLYRIVNGDNCTNKLGDNQ